MGPASETPQQTGIFRFIDPDLSIPASQRAIYASPAPKRVVEEEIALHDLRAATDLPSGQAGLDTQAFTWAKHQFSLSAEELLQGDNVENVYVQEVKDLVLKVTGAKRAVAHQAAFRRGLATKQENLNAVHPAGGEFDEATLKMPRDRFQGN